MPYQYLIDSVGGNIEDARGVLSLLFETARSEMLQLRAGIRADDPQLVEQAAHQLSGATGTCGLTEIYEKLRLLESQATVEPLDSLRDSVEEIGTLLQQAEATCDEDLARHAGEATP